MPKERPEEPRGPDQSTSDRPVPPKGAQSAYVDDRVTKALVEAEGQKGARLSARERSDVLAAVVPEVDPEGTMPDMTREIRMVGRRRRVIWRMSDSLDRDAISRALTDKIKGRLTKREGDALRAVEYYTLTYRRLEDDSLAMSQLAKRAGQREDAVGRHLARLAELGVIEFCAGAGRRLTRVRIRVPLDWQEHS